MHPLISAEDLHRRLAEVSVLDVRWRLGGPPGDEEFARGHVPGAAYVDLERTLAGPASNPVDDRGRHPLPDPARFEQAMREAGVCDNRPVVVYDDWQGRAAARAWWLLLWAGHPDVRVLDGGWGAWKEAGLPVEEGPGGRVEPGTFAALQGRMPVVELPAEGRVLVDARDRERFRGDREPVDPSAGHIPGAVCIPTTDNLRPDGRFREPMDLERVYAQAGEEPVVYCGSGVTACHDLLALALTGRQGTLYAGSWSGWVSDASRPVATGE